MSGKIKIQHTVPATGSPEADMRAAEEYLLVTKQGNEVMVAYSHEVPEDAAPLLMEAAQLLGRFNQIQQMSQTARSFGQGVVGQELAGGRPRPTSYGDSMNQQRGKQKPLTDAESETLRAMSGPPPQAEYKPNLMSEEAEPEDVPPTEVERELDSY